MLFNNNGLSYKEKDLIKYYGKTYRLEKTIIAKFEKIENFYSDLPRINIGWKSNNEVFSPRKSYHKIQI